MSPAALARTVRLLQLDFFPGLSEEEIVAGLESRRVGIRVAPEAGRSAAGQSSAASTAILVSQLGGQVAIEMEEVDLLGRQPPFPVAGLRAALLEGSRALIRPFTYGRHERPDVDIRIGALRADPAAERSIGVSVVDWACEVGPDVGGACEGELPFGAGLGAVAAVAECLREAVAAIAADHLVTLSGQHYLGPPRTSRLSLPPLHLGPAPDLGAVDMVSGGAIANATMSMLLRIPDLTGAIRVIEDDIVDISNLNRCGLFTREVLGEPKSKVIAAYGGDRLTIRPAKARLTAESLSRLAPLAPRIAVGVDHIPSRWFAQEQQPAWLGVAGTSHLDAIISEHRPGMPCAGCLHPRDEETEGPLPTISFVSALAGLLLAYRLLAVAVGAPATPPDYAWCLALDGSRGLGPIGLGGNPDCPVGCHASRVAAGALHA